MPRWSRMQASRRPRHFRRGRPAAQSAFTLVELAIVAAVIAIAGAIAVPRFSSAHLRASLTGAADRICADIDRARRHAVASEAWAVVGFGAHSDRYAVAWDGGDTRYTVELGEPPLRVNLAGFAGGDKENLIVFGPNGLSEAGSGIVISNKGGGILIVVDRAGNTARKMRGDEDELLKKLELLFPAPPPNEGESESEDEGEDEDGDEGEDGGEGEDGDGNRDDSSGGLLRATIGIVTGLL